MEFPKIIRLTRRIKTDMTKIQEMIIEKKPVGEYKKRKKVMSYYRYNNSDMPHKLAIQAKKEC
jgi:hypothetical protein